MIAEACPRANPTMKISNPTIRRTKEARTNGHAATADASGDRE
jgi:hypothetical protein